MNRYFIVITTFLVSCGTKTNDQTTPVSANVAQPAATPTANQGSNINFDRAVGNGGHAVQCAGNNTLRLLDYVEADDTRWKIDLGATSGDEVQVAKTVVQRLSRLDPVSSVEIGAKIDAIANEIRFVDQTLPFVGDTGQVLLPNGCKLVQAALQMAHQLPGRGNYFVDKKVWQALPFESRVGLVLHEATYRVFIDNGAKDSSIARYFNGYLSSSNSIKDTREAYFKLLEELKKQPNTPFALGLPVSSVSIVSAFESYGRLLTPTALTYVDSEGTIHTKTLEDTVSFDPLTRVVLGGGFAEPQTVKFYGAVFSDVRWFDFQSKSTRSSSWMDVLRGDIGYKTWHASVGKCKMKLLKHDVSRSFEPGDEYNEFIKTSVVGDGEVADLCARELSVPIVIRGKSPQINCLQQLYFYKNWTPAALRAHQYGRKDLCEQHTPTAHLGGQFYALVLREDASLAVASGTAVFKAQSEIVFHENGFVKTGTLAKETTLRKANGASATVAAGTPVNFDETGKLAE